MDSLLVINVHKWNYFSCTESVSLWINTDQTVWNGKTIHFLKWILSLPYNLIKPVKGKHKKKELTIASIFLGHFKSFLLTS